jgi:hypothetical protein
MRSKQHFALMARPITKFLNRFIRHGRKTHVTRAVYKSLLSLRAGASRLPARAALTTPVKHSREIFLLVSKRRAAQTLSIPTPTKRYSTRQEYGHLYSVTRKFTSARMLFNQLELLFVSA